MLNSDELSYLFDKSFDCPICGYSFKAKSVRIGRCRVISRDLDTMPRYLNANPLFYDVVICPSCGYSSLMKNFNNVKPQQIESIKSHYDPRIIPREYPETYDLDIAIERYKRALVYSILGKDKASDQAYICLKIAWMLRLKNDPEESNYLRQALNGFNIAYEKESFPICGMSEHGIMFLIGELSRRTGNTNDALKWLGKVITSTNVSSRLKEMARDSKDLIINNNLI